MSVDAGVEVQASAETIARAPVRRVRGLRFPALPTGAMLAQVFGGAAALFGSYLTFGAGVTLIAGGVAGAVLGALKESNRI